MTDNFFEVKRIKRFGKNISVLKRGNLTLHFIEDEKYFGAYEKLFRFLKDYGGEEEISVLVAFAGERYISFIVKACEFSLPLNYSLKSGFFERDSVVIRDCRVKKSRVKKALKDSGAECESFSPRVYVIADGIGVVCDKKGEKRIKIRQ